MFIETALVLRQRPSGCNVRYAQFSEAKTSRPSLLNEQMDIAARWGAAPDHSRF